MRRQLGRSTEPHAGFTEGDSDEQRLRRLEDLLATATDKASAVAALMATLCARKTGTRTHVTDARNPG